MVNKVILVGRLTRDPELRYSGAGKAVTKFTLACDSYGEDEADFIPVVTFGKTAEACAEYLRKGRLCAVEGRWKTGSYENNEGRRVYTNDCLASNVRFLESSRDNQQPNNSSYSNGPADPFGDDGKPISFNDDDLPF